jgi:hypothetical protein
MTRVTLQVNHAPYDYFGGECSEKRLRRADRLSRSLDSGKIVCPLGTGRSAPRVTASSFSPADSPGSRPGPWTSCYFKPIR